MQLPPNTRHLHSAQTVSSVLGLGYNRAVHYLKRCVQTTVECRGHVVTKSIRSRARRFCPANHDAHDTCGPVHIVSSLKHSTWLDFAQLASRGTNWWGESLEETFRMDPASLEEDSSRSHLRKFRGGYLADVLGRISRIMKIDLAKEGVMSYLHYSLGQSHTLTTTSHISLLPKHAAFAATRESKQKQAKPARVWTNSPELHISIAKGWLETRIRSA